MNRAPKPRRAVPAVLVDTARYAVGSGRISLLLLLLVLAIAVVGASTAHAIVPYVVYGGL
ncbi:MAG TPA: hypothetical protein PKD80_15385 [Microthrixaceae bacterium]|nr:hypothetical protein [Microthrixaceae bacterium]HMT24145.1 hypothetical protein [Microthrixaceae bacterium]HMT61537.1 hypothetical protein [Microthrixaceae bacterium]